MDAVEAAGSGHPGTAMALAPVAHTLFQHHVRHDPTSPDWAGRDRFVLSCGHASILLYTQLFLTGYDLSLEDLKQFRQLNSRTPGHPEYGHTAGVETTTGPLGQGLATAVGMAMALKRRRAIYDPESVTSLFNETVWVLCSDGDIQEGISYEAASLAGRHELDNMVVIYDDNKIQIEGTTDLALREDVGQRFAAQGWNVEHVGLAADGDIDLETLDKALIRGKAHVGQPTLIVLRSQIAFGAPNAINTAGSHGAPLGSVEAEAARRALNGVGSAFDVDEATLAYTRQAAARGREVSSAWEAEFKAWRDNNADKAAQWDAAHSAAALLDLDAALPEFAPGSKIATRDASSKTIQALAEVMPHLWGGSADLGDSNKTVIAGGGSFLPEDGQRTGRNVHWGVREHAMSAAMNGATLVGGSRMFVGTFLVFSDYQKPAIRLASLMQLPVTFVWTHDSVALGADGPTHQPIEHLAALRALPGFSVIRPAEARETAAAWAAALQSEAPCGLVLARQGVPVLEESPETIKEGVRRGAYVVGTKHESPDVILIATGSELELALAAQSILAEEGTSASVVSMPCREWFEKQDRDYRDSILPPAVTARVAVEAASAFGWRDLIGAEGETVTIDRFGLSAPAEDALRETGMTVQAVVAAAKSTISQSSTVPSLTNS
jgi:transketolase